MGWFKRNISEQRKQKREIKKNAKELLRNLEVKSPFFNKSEKIIARLDRTAMYLSHVYSMIGLALEMKEYITERSTYRTKRQNQKDQEGRPSFDAEEEKFFQENWKIWNLEGKLQLKRFHDFLKSEILEDIVLDQDYILQYELNAIEAKHQFNVSLGFNEQESLKKKELREKKSREKLKDSTKKRIDDLFKLFKHYVPSENLVSGLLKENELQDIQTNIIRDIDALQLESEELARKREGYILEKQEIKEKEERKKAENKLRKEMTKIEEEKSKTMLTTLMGSQKIKHSQISPKLQELVNIVTQIADKTQEMLDDVQNTKWASAKDENNQDSVVIKYNDLSDFCCDVEGHKLLFDYYFTANKVNILPEEWLFREAAHGKSPLTDVITRMRNDCLTAQHRVDAMTELSNGIDLKTILQDKDEILADLMEDEERLEEILKHSEFVKILDDLTEDTGLMNLIGDRIDDHMTKLKDFLENVANKTREARREDVESLIQSMTQMLNSPKTRTDIVKKLKKLQLAILLGKDPRDEVIGTFEWANRITGSVEDLAFLVTVIYLPDPFSKKTEPEMMLKNIKGLEKSMIWYSFVSTAGDLMSLFYSIRYLLKEGRDPSAICTAIGNLSKCVGSGTSLVLNFVQESNLTKTLGNVGGGLWGGGSVLTSLVQMTTESQNAHELASIKGRFKMVMKHKEWSSKIKVAFDNIEGLGLAWYKIIKRIGRRRSVSIGGAVTGGLSSVSGGLAIAGLIASGAAIPVAGWIVAGVASAISLGIAGNKVYRHVHKKNKLKKIRKHLAAVPSPLDIPEYMKTLGDWYRYIIAHFIYCSVLDDPDLRALKDSNDQLVGPDCITAGIILAYVLFGGSPGAAALDAAKMDINGLISFLKG